MKIGVILFGLLGDVLMRTVALRELRQLFPDALIYCYVDPIGAEVLSLSQDDKRFVETVDRAKRSRLKYLVRKLSLHWRVRKERFDVLLDLYNGPSSHQILLTSGANKTLCIKRGKVIARPLSQRKEFRRHPNQRHLSNLYFALLDSLDQEPMPTPSVLPWVDPGLDVGLHGGVGDGRHCLVSMATGDPKKNPPISLVSEMLAQLYQHHRVRPVIVLNPGDEEPQSALSQCLSDLDIPHICLPPMRLAELAGLMRSVLFSILPDTGLFHLGVGVGGNVFGVFTHTHPSLVDPELTRVQILFQADERKGTDLHGLGFGTRQINSDKAVSLLRDFVDRLIMERSPA